MAVKDAQNIYYSNQGSSAMNIRKFDGSSWSSLPDSESTTINTQSLAVDANGVVYAVSASFQRKSETLCEWRLGTSREQAVLQTHRQLLSILRQEQMAKMYVSFNNNGYVNVYQNDANASDTQAWTPVGVALERCNSIKQQKTIIPLWQLIQITTFTWHILLGKN